MKKIKNSSKIAIVNYMEPLPDECGRNWRAHQIANILAKKGYITELYTSSFSHFYCYQRKNNTKSYKNYLVKFCFANSYERQSKFKRILSQFVFSLNLMVRIYLFKPKSVIASYPHSFALISLVILKPILRFKLIIDIRDSLKQPSMGFLSKIYNLIEKLLSYIWVLNADILIGPGQEVYKYLPKILKNKSRKIYKNIPMTYENNNKKIKFESREKSNFIFIGSLSKAFELENYLEYFKQNPKFNLFILGGGPLLNAYKTKYCNFKNIRFLGQVKYEIISNFASISYFGLMPYSDKENRFAYHITNKLGEYLSFGITPLIPDHCFEMSNFVSKFSCGRIYNKKNLYEFLDNLIYEKEDFTDTSLKSIHQKYLSYNYLSLLINKLIDPENKQR